MIFKPKPNKDKQGFRNTRHHTKNDVHGIPKKPKTKKFCFLVVVQQAEMPAEFFMKGVQPLPIDELARRTRAIKALRDSLKP